MMKKALIIANPEKERATELAAKSCEILSSCCEIVAEISSFDQDLSGYNADFAVVLGGDGTVLNAVNRLGQLQIPLITVNLGRLGFLAEIAPENLRITLEKFCQGELNISKRMLLECKISRDDKIIWSGLALNEFAFISPIHGRMCHLQLSVDCEGLTEIAGDGAVVSTPTGSTAYALSAGGPILNPELRGILLVPVCPHRLSNRPLVLGENEVLSVTGESILNCDGHEKMTLQNGDTAIISCSEISAKIVLAEKCGRYDVLRRKLGWGE